MTQLPRAAVIGAGSSGVAGTWQLQLDDGSTERFDALFVANGHHWDARWPEPAFPGSDTLEGLQLHSHDYTGEDPNFFRDIVAA